MRKAAHALAAVAAIAAVVGFGPAMPRASAELDASTLWSASGRADAMAVEYLNTSAPVFGAEPVIYGTPASASSLVDSNNQSNAWAAAPYPGDIMVGAADNGNGALVGAGFPGIFQSYPFYVQSEYPIAPNKVQDQSGNRLAARSDQYKSSSDARSGLITGDFLAALQAQASSLASVDPDTGELTAIADSRLDAFRLTDKLQIGRSTAHAKVTRVGEELKKESSFTLGSIIVNGVEMSYGDEGFKFADQKGQSPGDPKPLFDALKTAGITVEILPAKGTDTSIESAGMKISQVTDYGAGKQRISFIIGRVSAAITGEAKPVSGGLLDGLPAGPAETVSGSESTGPQADNVALGGEETMAVPDPTEAAAGFNLSLSTPSVVPDLSLPAVSGGAASVPPVVAAVNPGAGAKVNQSAPPEVRLAAPASIGRGLRDDDISGFYLALGGLAALLTVAAFVLRGGGKAAKAAAAGSVLRLPS